METQETFGAGWADGLAEFREDMREKETARSQARAATREEEESFYVVGAKDARFVDFGADVDDYGDETEGWDSPDDDEEDVFEGRTAMEAAAYADIEAKYRAGQAKGAVEFDLGGDDDFEADADGETRSRGIPSEMRCFDTAKIYIKAGDGGRGMVAFRREAFVAQGGPYGGNGGNGGAIFFEADEGINSLVGFRKKVHHRAEAGGNGGGKRMQGSDARDLTVLVPPGTVVRNADTGEVIAEMFAHGHREMIIDLASESDSEQEQSPAAPSLSARAEEMVAMMGHGEGGEGGEEGEANERPKPKPPPPPRRRAAAAAGPWAIALAERADVAALVSLINGAYASAEGDLWAEGGDFKRTAPPEIEGLIDARELYVARTEAGAAARHILGRPGGRRVRRVRVGVDGGGVDGGGVDGGGVDGGIGRRLQAKDGGVDEGGAVGQELLTGHLL